MYAKYNCCPPPQPRPVTNCCNPKYTSKIDNTQPGAIPESVRISNNSWNCSTATVSVHNAVEFQSSCVTSFSGASKISIPVASSPPVVTVRNVPASLTMEQRVRELQTNVSNPYDPKTRFAAYFPPAPMPYICPERIPNNDTKPSTADCLPIRRFQGSAQAANLV